MNKKPYQICKRCVMDTSDEDIVFDEKGYCNHCTNYFEKIKNRTYVGKETEKELKTIIKKIKNSGKNKKYDCLIGISGGIDSSYVCYIAKQYELRPLLIYIDNGWYSDYSRKNIQNISKITGFEYQTYKLDEAEFNDLQLSFLKASVPETGTPIDNIIQGVLHKVAAQNDIKFIISGSNFATEGILPKTWQYDAKDLKYLKAIHKEFGLIPIKKTPLFDWKREIYYKFIKKIKIIYILNYVPFSLDDVLQTLKDKLNWEYYGGKHYESHYTTLIHSYYLPKKFNIEYRRATLATRICNNQISRNEALEILNEKPYDEEAIKEKVNFVIKKFGISLDEFNAIMNDKPKNYRDYPNSEKKLQFIYKIYLKYFRKFNYNNK